MDRGAETGRRPEVVDRLTQIIKKLSSVSTILIVDHNMYVFYSIAVKITVLHRVAILAEGPYAEVSMEPRVIEVYMGTV